MDHCDLINPKEKTQQEANKFIGSLVLEGVDFDTRRSFTEMYSSTPEPRIGVWITYFWTVFRAKGTTAELIVSDWEKDHDPTGPFGQQQTFNFIEVQPYHD
jgi:hypothetical protein